MVHQVETLLENFPNNHQFSKGMPVLFKARNSLEERTGGCQGCGITKGKVKEMKEEYHYVTDY